MNTVDIYIKSIATFYRRIANFKRDLTNWKTEFVRTGDYILTGVEKNFGTGGRRLLSRGWKPLTKGTIADRKAQGYKARPILVRSGDLQKSFFKRASKTGVLVKSSSPYYRYHQTGTRRIPQRQMLGLNGYDIQAISKIFSTAVQAKLIKSMTKAT